MTRSHEELFHESLGAIYRQSGPGGPRFTPLLLSYPVTTCTPDGVSEALSADERWKGKLKRPNFCHERIADALEMLYMLRLA